MALSTLGQLARKALPGPVFQAARRAGTALVTPLLFSWQTGHFRSSVRARALDRGGRPVPWYTYPAIDFLRGKDFTGKRVLEWGSGQSTLWWASRAEQVIAFESDAEWFAMVGRTVPGNVTLHLVPDTLEGAHEHLPEQPVDLIVIDGLDRFRCAQASLPLLAPDGGILLDNAQGHWGPPGTYPIMDLFREHGFSRVDFFGFAPGVHERHCTSLFFKDGCFLLKGSENPVLDGR